MENERTCMDTLPETNSSHLKMVVSNRNCLFQRSIFRCYVSFREGMYGMFTYTPPEKPKTSFLNTKS